MQRLEVCNLASNIQDKLMEFVEKVNEYGIGCMSRDIETDNNMLFFYDENTWQKFVDVFDILGMDFTTGEAEEEYPVWYINFEYSDGISD